MKLFLLLFALTISLPAHSQLLDAFLMGAGDYSPSAPLQGPNAFLYYDAMKQHAQARSQALSEAAALVEQGWQFYKAENYQQAYDYIVEGINQHKQASGKKKDRAILYVLAAQCAAVLDDKGMVYKLLKYSHISTLTRNRDAVYHIALIHTSIGDYKTAIYYLKKTLKIDKYFKNGYRLIVGIYEKKLGTYRKAIKYRSQFKKLYPNEFLYE